MEHNFFVILSTQSGGAAPMTDDEGEMAFYESADAARADAESNMLGAHFGYEIFERGTGDA